MLGCEKKLSFGNSRSCPASSIATMYSRRSSVVSYVVGGSTNAHASATGTRRAGEGGKRRPRPAPPRAAQQRQSARQRPPTSNIQRSQPLITVHPTIVTSLLSETRSRPPSLINLHVARPASNGVSPSTERTASVPPSGDQASGRSMLSLLWVSTSLPLCPAEIAAEPPSRFIDATVRSPSGCHAGLNSPRATPVLDGPASSAAVGKASEIAPVARSTTRATTIGCAPLSAAEYASDAPSGEICQSRATWSLR